MNNRSGNICITSAMLFIFLLCNCSKSADMNDKPPKPTSNLQQVTEAKKVDNNAAYDDAIASLEKSAHRINSIRETIKAANEATGTELETNLNKFSK